MLKQDQWNRNLPGVELDHRVREARRRAELLERQLVRNNEARVVRVFRVLRLLAVNVAGGRRGDDSTGSPSDQRPCDYPIFLSTCRYSGPPAVSALVRLT